MFTARQPQTSLQANVVIIIAIQYVVRGSIRTWQEHEFRESRRMLSRHLRHERVSKEQRDEGITIPQLVTRTVGVAAPCRSRHRLARSTHTEFPWSPSPEQ